MIDPKAVINKEAILGEGVTVGPYAVIEKGVKLGDGVTVSPFAHLKGNTCIGDNTFIGTGSVIGEAPQILGVQGNIGKIYIGKSNFIREYVTINSSASYDKATSLGDNNLLMAFSHVGHDCKLSNNIVLCNSVLLAGHVEVQNNAFVSANVSVHQFSKIGALSMIGGHSRVSQDVPPFMMVMGNSRVWGLNLVGLKRAGLDKEDFCLLKKAYKIIYCKKLSMKNILAELETMGANKVKEIIVFILSSKRGICKAKRNTFIEKVFLNYPYLFMSKFSSCALFLKNKRLTRFLKENG